MRVVSLVPGYYSYWLLLVCCGAVVHANSHGNTTLLAQQLLQAQAGGLVWTNLSVTTGQGKTIVQPFSGILWNGQVCGLLGPSGAGKSSLVATLAGTQTLTVQGTVFQFVVHDKHKAFTSRIRPNQVAWLQQHDAFFEMLTVRETLELAARLELSNLTATQRHDLIQHKLIALGLMGLENRRIGSYVSKSSRLSGGERRRLSVALELLTSKQLFIADEPTTGLDATMSGRVMKLIHDTATDQDIPVLVVLHQPRSSVWHALDAVIFMASPGRVCYAGPRNATLEYFAALGYPCPAATNPAEYYVDLISIDPEDPRQAARDETRVQYLARAFQEYQQKQWKRRHKTSELELVVQPEPTTSSMEPHGRHKLRRWVAWIPRLGLLLRRSMRQNIRNLPVNLARLFASTGNAWLLCQLFPTIRGPLPTANSMADRAALLTTAAICVAFMSFQKSATLFEREYPVVHRELARHQYTTLEYLLAKVLAEIPLDACFAAIFAATLKQCCSIRIPWDMLTATFSLLTAAGASLGFLLGSIFSSQGLAVNAGLPVLVIFMVVGVINPGGVDPNRPPGKAVQFFKKFSPFASAIQAIMIGEYKDMKFVRTTGWFSGIRELPRLGAMSLVKNGNQVLDALGLSTETYTNAMKHLALLTVGNLVLSWIGLVRQHGRRQARQTSSDLSVNSTTRNNVKTTTTTTTSPPTIRRVRL